MRRQPAQHCVSVVRKHSLKVGDVIQWVQVALLFNDHAIFTSCISTSSEVAEQ